MSELTPCNYCNLKEARIYAKKKGERIVVGGRDKYGLIQIFSIPQGVKTRVAFANPKEYVHQWMAEIPDHCCC